LQLANTLITPFSSTDEKEQEHTVIISDSLEGTGNKIILFG